MRFEQPYFQESEYSNYYDYLARDYSKLAVDLKTHFRLTSGDKILDFGCGLGNLPYNLHKLGCKGAVGTDISYFAIKLGKDRGYPVQYHNIELLFSPKDYLLFIDILEHILNELELVELIRIACNDLRKGVIVRTPVTQVEGAPYSLPCSRSDRTHYITHSSYWWKRLFYELGLTIRECLNLPTIYCSENVIAWWMVMR